VTPRNAESAADRAFGSENRRRLIEEYFAARPPVAPVVAWRDVYRLLLWTDRTIGLAHCYESDKCQPGRPWYGRSLAFHSWLAAELGCSPVEMAGEIDWLFRRAVVDLVRSDAQEARAKSAAQRKMFANVEFPLPGEDPELVQIVSTALADFLAVQPSDGDWRALTRRIYGYVYQENKRKNLLGEGFEDVLTVLLGHIEGLGGYEVSNRALLGDIPGFHFQGSGEKSKRVDLALWGGPGATRTLVTAKWSVRADREEQFGTDFDAYVRANTGAPFDYVLVTNEFDAARLKAACERLAGNTYLFTSVVHVNPVGVLKAYGGTSRGAAGHLGHLVESGRLMGLGEWLAGLAE
jgi:hypothetical protein